MVSSVHRMASGVETNFVLELTFEQEQNGRIYQPC